MKTFAMAVVAAAALVATTNTAEARGWQYGMVTIVNRSGMDLNYQLKWGSGEWKNFTVKAGHTRNHWYDVGGATSGPTPRVRFDYDLNDGISWKTYTLQATGTNDTDPDSGTQYEFKKATFDTIDLYKK